MENFLQYFTEAKAPGLNITPQGKAILKNEITKDGREWNKKLADSGYGLSNVFKRNNKLKAYKVEDALADVLVDSIIKDLYKVIVKGEDDTVLSLPYSKFMIPLSEVPKKISRMAKGDESLIDFFNKEFIPDRETTPWAFDKEGKPRDDVYTFIPNPVDHEAMSYISSKRNDISRKANASALTNATYTEDWASLWLWLYNPIADVHHFTDVFQDRNLAPIEAREAGVKDYMGNRGDIADYFIEKPSLERMKEITDQYDKILKYRSRFDKKEKLDEGDAKILTTYDNGYRMVQLLSSRGCKITGTAMGHCVGNYDPQRRPLLQLIGPEDTHHATIELSLTNTLSQNIDGSERDSNRDSNEVMLRFYEVAQIKGKYNKPLTSSYERMVKKFFEDWGVGDNIITLEQDNTQIPAALNEMPSSFKYI